MPLVEVTLTEGRTSHDLRALMHEVHAGVRRALGVEDTAVRVIVREVPPELWSSGDVTIAERRA
jgi:4-oxalocrotonate tautomerase